MEVKCINQGNYRDISTGRNYEVVETLENFYHIIANSGNIRSYSKRYFEIIPEPIIEDEDEIGVEENMEDEINIAFNDEDDIDYEVNGNDAILGYYEVCLSLKRAPRDSRVSNELPAIQGCLRPDPMLRAACWGF